MHIIRKLGKILSYALCMYLKNRKAVITDKIVRLKMKCYAPGGELLLVVLMKSCLATELVLL